MNSRVPDASATAGGAAPRVHVSRFRFVVGYAVLATFVVLGATYGFLLFVRNQREAQLDALRSLARLQVGQVTAVLSSRATDARVIARRLALIGVLEGAQSRTTTASRAAELARTLSDYSELNEFVAIIVVDASMRRLAPGSGWEIQPEEDQTLRAAMQSGRPRLAGLHEHVNGHFEFGLAQPIFAGGDSTRPVLGAVMLMLDARRSILARLDYAMPAGRSTETVFGRSNGVTVDVVYSTRYLRSVAPFSVKRSVADTSVMMVKAFRQQQEVIGEALDYRGIPVIAAAAPVPGTPWVIVTKTDQAEADAPFRYFGEFIAAAVLLLLGLGAAMTRTLWLSKQRDAEQAQAMIASRYMAATTASLDGYLLLDEQGRILDTNGSVERMTGYSRQELLGLVIGDLRAPPAAGVQTTVDRLARILEHGAGQFISVWQSRAGATFDVEISTTVLQEGGERRIILYVRDISESVRTRRRLEVLNALYLFLSRANEAIFHARSADELYDAVCRGAVSDGQLVLAWAGVVDDATQRVRVATAAGPAADYTTNLRLSLDPADSSSTGPSATALRTEQPVVCNDFMKAEITAPWHEFARPYGLGASVAVPVVVRGKAVAVLNFYARDTDVFSDDVVSALAEVGRNTALSLEKFSSDAARRAEEKLREASEARLLEAQQIARVCSWEVDYATERMLWSDEGYRILEIDPTPDRALTWRDLLARMQADDHASLQQAFSDSLEARASFELSVRLLFPDGHEKWLLIKCRSEFHEDGRPLRSVGTLQDITDQRVAALELAQHRDHLEELISLRTAALEQATARLQMSDERLKAMFAMSQQASTLQEHDILRLAVNEAARMTESPDSYIHLIAEDKPTIELGLFADRTLAHGELPADVHQALAAGDAWGEAVRTQAPVISNEPASAVPTGAATAPLEFARHLVVPHGEGGRVRLVLGVANRAQAYEPSDVSELQLIAHDVWTIIQRRRADLALDEAYRRIGESEQRFAWAADAATEGIWDWNVQTDDLFFSDVTVTMLGYAPDEVPRRFEALFGLVHPDDAERFTEAVRQRLADRGVYEEEIRMRAKNGGYRWILSRAKVVASDATGRPARVVGANADLTNRRRIEDELRAAKDAADAANRAKSAFLAVMSHEIRTPMNGVLGMAEILAQSDLPPRDREAVRTIQSSATSLLGIIDDVLDFSKIEAGRLELERVDCSSVEIIDSVYRALMPIAMARGVDLRYFVDPELPERIIGDPTRLRQVMYNLIGNAVKFSGGREMRRGRVAVRLELAPASPKQMRFSVSDNGVGMSEDALAGLFTSFAQAERSTTRRFGGTGLGLAIVKRLVELMRGTVEVSSAIGVGAAFTVTLPLEAARAQPADAITRLDGLECVLVGGDSCWDADDLRRYLSPLGAHVRVVGSGAEAVAVAQKIAPPVVIVRELGEVPSELDPGLYAIADARHVLITRGQRQVPRVVGTHVVVIDREFLRRHTLALAVALAGGLREQEVYEPSSGAKVKTTLIAPSIAEARALGQLILVAEDDQTNQRVILRQLELLGFAAEIAADGAEALRMWEAGEYGLLLCDLHMPTLDGYGLTREIRRAEAGTGRRMPILALTANALKGEAARARALGIDAYLTKPVPLETLRTAITPWLLRSWRVPPPDGPHAKAGSSADDGRVGCVLDVSVLESLVGNDPLVVRELLEDFVESQARSMVELRAAVVTGDLVGVGAAAHKMKSAARSIGALHLGDLTAELESASKRFDGAGVAVGMSRIEACDAAVGVELDRWLAVAPDSA